MSPVECALRLSGVPGLSSSQRLDLMSQLLDFTAPGASHLASLRLSTVQQQAFLDYDADIIVQSFRWLESPLHHFLTPHSPCYPEQLKSIINFPLMLFVAGDPTLLASPQLAIVGSRHCSHYGREWGSWFSQALALSGLTITSGLALGIDGIAHGAVLEVQGKTLAVLGSGLQAVYPRQHQALAQQIIDSGGALVSEFPLSVKPLPAHFPRRNRIISGLSRGVLVVEATLRSGSLVTAKLALEQNRNVYALPGALGNPGSEGTHWLIQQGALLVAHPNNILEEMHSDFSWLPVLTPLTNNSDAGNNPPLPFPDVLANVGDEVTPVDVVAERAGQPVPAIVAKLLELELAGWIAAVPGGYVRLRRASHVRRTHVLI
ncbi:DNA-protecting protein DprA [Erwinia pyrifoliae]|uniref:DNA-protecting protein DprA n=1 Tax=Erwinia pyrifoliae TaxID=79967 RepID=A0ABY5X804_ERWPY|nr:DNA-protecting protein DprA [Erwinia pyrifoliae]AUX71341.1 DNA-protecting protein DprA [Erwinia pyrifoliae]MCA8874937.1 DNA-protecting protein DprA [Erwinia pyrifoliae]MCT2385745.1 DNA-protecting protein DprA [Erwinia pyrifoliae]MCU8588679.1 DNA-protecting protein DprA [Erwinia pyrifoliae]UWS29041.1 DNA-protecting protein DprA [Erwinia pyrifoliae]